MDRNELVRRLVLNAITDDYENVDQVILRSVAKDGAKCGIVIERADVVNALASLVEDGLAKAYLLSGTVSGTGPFATEIQGMPRLDAVEEYFKTYFYVTNEGMDLHCSPTVWPTGLGWSD
jgi:hypothetical protein